MGKFNIARAGLDGNEFHRQVGRTGIFPSGENPINQTNTGSGSRRMPNLP